MIEQMRWFDRQFTFDLPLGAFPSVVERLRGTPVRLEERVAGVPVAVLTTRPGDAWSAQEHCGHLLDLEPLWMTRLEQLLAGSVRLVAADLENKATHHANHNARPMGELLDGFRSARTALVRQLEALEEPDVGRSAIHPRLKRSIRVIDHAWFVAEHDDHHLARIANLVTRA
jgi:uncharacterized damage-inducible protein DinB